MIVLLSFCISFDVSLGSVELDASFPGSSLFCGMYSLMYSCEEGYINVCS